MGPIDRSYMGRLTKLYLFYKITVLCKVTELIIRCQCMQLGAPLGYAAWGHLHRMGGASWAGSGLPGLP